MIPRSIARRVDDLVAHIRAGGEVAVIARIAPNNAQDTVTYFLARREAHNSISMSIPVLEIGPPVPSHLAPAGSPN